MSVENNKANRDTLIEEVIESWLDVEVYQYAKQQLNKEYAASTPAFDIDWECTFPPDN